MSRLFWSIHCISFSTDGCFNNIEASLSTKLPIQCPELAEVCQRHMWAWGDLMVDISGVMDKHSMYRITCY